MIFVKIGRGYFSIYLLHKKHHFGVVFLRKNVILFFLLSGLTLSR